LRWPLSASKLLKTAILHLKLRIGLKVDILLEIAILRHLEGFLEKSEESRPPLKLKNNGEHFLLFFFQGIQVSGGLGCNEKIFKKTLFGIVMWFGLQKYSSHL